MSGECLGAFVSSIGNVFVLKEVILEAILINERKFRKVGFPYIFLINSSIL